MAVAWVAQIAMGGRILTPWANACCDGGLLALERLGDGSAIGRTAGTPVLAPEPR